MPFNLISINSYSKDFRISLNESNHIYLPDGSGITCYLNARDRFLVRIGCFDCWTVKFVLFDENVTSREIETSLRINSSIVLADYMDVFYGKEPTLFTMTGIRSFKILPFWLLYTPTQVEYYTLTYLPFHIRYCFDGLICLTGPMKGNDFCFVIIDFKALKYYFFNFVPDKFGFVPIGITRLPGNRFRVFFDSVAYNHHIGAIDIPLDGSNEMILYRLMQPARAIIGLLGDGSIMFSVKGTEIYLIKPNMDDSRLGKLISRFASFGRLQDFISAIESMLRTLALYNNLSSMSIVFYCFKDNKAVTSSVHIDEEEIRFHIPEPGRYFLRHIYLYEVKGLERHARFKRWKLERVSFATELRRLTYFESGDLDKLIGTILVKEEIPWTAPQYALDNTIARNIHADRTNSLKDLFSIS